MATPVMVAQKKICALASLALRCGRFLAFFRDADADPSPDDLNGGPRSNSQPSGALLAGTTDA